MKAITILTTTLFLLLTFAVSAQRTDSRQKMTPEQQATKMVEKMTTQLQLNAKQQKELTTYYTETFKKRAEARQKNMDNKDSMRENMKKERDAADAQLKKILTPDQYKKYKADEEKRKEEMKKRGDRPNGSRR